MSKVSASDFLDKVREIHKVFNEEYYTIYFPYDIYDLLYDLSNHGFGVMTIAGSLADLMPGYEELSDIRMIRNTIHEITEEELENVRAGDEEPKFELTYENIIEKYPDLNDWLEEEDLMAENYEDDFVEMISVRMIWMIWMKIMMMR